MVWACVQLNACFVQDSWFVLSRLFLQLLFVPLPWYIKQASKSKFVSTQFVFIQYPFQHSWPEAFNEDLTRAALLRLMLNHSKYHSGKDRRQEAGKKTPPLPPKGSENQWESKANLLPDTPGPASIIAEESLIQKQGRVYWGGGKCAKIRQWGQLHCRCLIFGRTSELHLCMWKGHIPVCQHHLWFQCFNHAV